jgi:hypothetical protein
MLVKEGMIATLSLLYWRTDKVRDLAIGSMLRTCHAEHWANRFEAFWRLT